jgi:L-iditol 2-dehydrogenase
MRIEDRPVPVIADDEVLVKVQAVGICGSDQAYYYGESPLETETGKGPLILGHEVAGEVVEVGKFPGERGLFKVGDRVSVDPVQYCNACEICAKGYVNLCENKDVIGVSVDGAFTEFVKSKYTGLHKLPESVPYEHGCLCEPMACATYALHNMDIVPGQTAVVMGPGPIGLMLVQMVKSAGAGQVIMVGTRDYRLELAKKLGADEIINTGDKNSPYYSEDLTASIASLTDGAFADRVVTMTGSATAMEQALEISGRRSTVVFFGLPGGDAVVRVPALPSIFWDKTIRFSWLAPHTWPAAIDAIARGLVDLSPLVTHKVALDGLEDGIRKLRAREDNAVKGVMVA